jgi:hypothetical protein
MAVEDHPHHDGLLLEHEYQLDGLPALKRAAASMIFIRPPESTSL